MSWVEDITSAPFGPTSASAQLAANGACDWYGKRQLEDHTCAAPAKALAASPQSAITVSVVLAARMRSNKSALPGSVALSFQLTLSSRAALIASHSRSATTPTKSPLRTIRAPGMPAIELSSMLKGLAPSP